MLDFHLEDSLNCMKDYFVTDSGQRYCGNSLRNTESMMILGIYFEEC